MQIRGFSAFVLHLVIACLFLFCAAALYGETLERVIAVVNGDIITLNDYQRYMISIGKKKELSLIEEYHLKKLIEEKVLLHEAVKRGVSVSDSELDNMLEETRKAGAISEDEFRKELLKEGVTYEDYKRTLRDKILVTKLIRIDLDSKIAVSAKETGEYYNSHRGRFLKNPSRVGIKVIFLRLKQDATLTELTDLKLKALKVVALIRQGYDFETMRDRYSEEPWSGSDIRPGEFSRGELIPEFNSMIFAMKIEEVSDPIWLKDGVYIVKLISRTEEEVRTLQEVRSEIERVLFEQKREKAYNEWMKSLLDASSITIID